MKTLNYHARISAHLAPREVTEKINRLNAWWAGNFEGSAQKLDDVFTLRFGETWVTFKVVEMVAERRIEWEVIDCCLHWLADKTEWNNTYLVWDLAAQKNSTQVDFTHVGLIPEVECYNECRKGWDFYIKESLAKWLTENRGLPHGR